MGTETLQKFLKAVGLLSLAAWTGVGALAWYGIKGKVVVQVRDDEPERGKVSQTALLRDEVEGLGMDLRELAGTLEKSLEGLARGLSEDGAERFAAQADELARLTRKLTRLEAGLEAREAQRIRDYRELRARVDAGLAGRRPALTTRPIAVARTAPSLAAEEAPAARDPGVGSEVEAPARTVPAADQPTERASKPARGAFLSFKLSPKTFDPSVFEEYEVIPALSRVGFDAQSTLHDFSGVSSKIRGSLAYTFAAPAKDCRARFEVEATDLKTGLDGRDEGLREHLATDEFPSILFVLETLDEAVVDPKAKTIEAIASGKITIRGVSRALRMPVKVTVDRRLRQLVVGEAAIKLTDFKIPVPSKLGIVGMHDDLKIWIALRLRPKARIEK